MSVAFKYFIDEIKAHGIMVKYAQLRQGGEIVEEFSTMPVKTRLNSFSVCKSVIGIAIGIAAEEGLLQLDEKICDIFPEYVNTKTSPNLLQVTIRDLLTMTSGLDNTLFFCDWPERYYVRDWIQYFFNVNFPHKPGKVFVYSNLNTYMATCCIERKAKMNLVDYLRDRLFEPIGIGNPDWTNCPLGHVVSANGWHATIDELGYFGELVLREGNWHGCQLVSAEYVREAIRPQVDTNAFIRQLEGAGFNPNLFKYGYGYQFWRTPVPNTTMCSGNYGQAIMVSFDKDAVFSYQAMAGFEPTRRKIKEIGILALEKL